MKITNKINFRIAIKKQLRDIGLFFKNNLIKLVSIFMLTLTSTLLISLGINTSTKSSIDSIAFAAANIAKDNSYQKVHFESKLSYFSDSSFSANSEKNGKVFSNAHRIANQSFLKYSSAAFFTRNNFYTVPVDGSSEKTKHVLFEYNFLNTAVSLKNITPSTNNEIVKKYTTSKYVGGVLDENYTMTKSRMETIDLFLLFRKGKVASGYPLFLPDYVAQKIVEENTNINSLEECLGLEGTILVSGVKSTVYIKNIIVTSPRVGDPYDLDDCDFTDNNVRFAKFLKQLYGDYSLMFFSPMYSQNRSMACADFDSEYFKIKSYLENDLIDIYSEESISSIYSFEKENDTFVLKENEEFSSLMTNTIGKRIKNGNFSYFDGNLVPLVIGFILFGGAVFCLFINFSSRKYQREKLTWHFLISSFVPIIVMNIFCLLFLFFFSSKQAFVAFYFSSLSIVILISFLIELITTLIIYFLRRYD